MLIAYLVVLCVATVYLIATLQLPWGSLQHPGPGFFPSLVGALFLGTALTAIVQRLRGRRPHRREGLSQPPDPRRILAVVVPMIAYPALVDVLGHIVMAGLLGMSVRILGARTWLQSLLVAVGCGLGTYLLFEVLLGVRLPRGLL